MFLFFFGGSGFWGCFRVPFFVLWVFLGFFVSRLLLNIPCIATELLLIRLRGWTGVRAVFGIVAVHFRAILNGYKFALMSVLGSGKVLIRSR